MGNLTLLIAVDLEIDDSVDGFRQAASGEHYDLFGKYADLLESKIEELTGQDDIIQIQVNEFARGGVEPRLFSIAQNQFINYGVYDEQG